MFNTKFEKNYQRELKREIRIQNIMKEKNYDRVKAVHQCDYDNEMKRHTIGSKVIIYFIMKF